MTTKSVPTGKHGGRSSKAAGLMLALTFLLPASLMTVASPASAAAAPSCVSLQQWEEYATWWKYWDLDWNKARATNNCSDAVRIKLNWSWASDTGCYTIQPGRSLYSERSVQMRAEVTAVETC